MKALTIIIILSLLYINNSQLNSQEPREIFIDYLTKYKIVYDSKEDYDNHLNLFLQQYQNPEFNIYYELYGRRFFKPQKQEETTINKN